MSQENIETVRLAYDVAFVRRSPDGMLDRLADDFTWHQRSEWPGRPSFRPEQMPQLWADLDETYSEFNRRPVQFTEIGEYVVVTVETSARLRASAARVEGRVWHVWRMRNGIALEGRVYSDRREALDAVGLVE